MEENNKTDKNTNEDSDNKNSYNYSDSENDINTEGGFQIETGFEVPSEDKKFSVVDYYPKELNLMDYNKFIYKDARSCAVKIICRYERSDSKLERLIDNEIRTNKNLNDFDKSLLNELANGVVRWMRRLDWFLNGFYRGNYEKCVPEIKNAMRVALYQILFLNKIPYSAAVNEAVEFIKTIHGEKHAGVVNGLLRTILRTLDALVWPTREIDEVNYLGIVQSHPNWIVRRWISRYGFDNTVKLCEANNRRPGINIRINKLKTTNEEFENYLSSKNINFAKSIYLSEFYTVRTFSKLYDDEMFKNGFFSIQDESAGLISHLLDPKEREVILDVCAAPGGKSSHIIELSGDKAEVVSIDKYLLKAEKMNSNFKRLGYNNVTAIHDDVSDPKTEAMKTKLIGKADKLLVDAPCSGFGVFSKKPDIKWKREPEDLYQLQKIQMEILESSVKYLKTGGVLVYSTCTIEPEENYEIVKNFLESHPEFELENASDFVDKRVVSENGCIETLPHIHGIDGAFGARLRKTR